LALWHAGLLSPSALAPLVGASALASFKATSAALGPAWSFVANFVSASISRMEAAASSLETDGSAGRRGKGHQPRGHRAQRGERKCASPKKRCFRQKSFFAATCRPPPCCCGRAGKREKVRTCMGGRCEGDVPGHGAGAAALGARTKLTSLLPCSHSAIASAAADVATGCVSGFISCRAPR
jgi:hypothetical protein